MRFSPELCVLGRVGNAPLFPLAKGELDGVVLPLSKGELDGVVLPLSKGELEGVVLPLRGS